MHELTSRSKWILLIAVCCSVVITACKKNQEGCTDPLAENYDPTATIDDGSCEYSSTSLEVTEHIETSTTWTNRVEANGQPDYIICKNIDVKADLIIEPGVRIEFCSGAELDINSGGSIKAIGTPSDNIVFTGKTETPGFWETVHVNSNHPDNRFEHVIFSYGGGSSYYDYAMVWVNDNNNGQASFKNVTFDNSKEIGLKMESGSTISGFENNTFSNNGTYGLAITSSHLSSLDAASDYNSGNTEPYIYVSNSKIVKNATWIAVNTPYLMTGTTDIEADVTVNAGAQFHMGADASLDIISSGSFNAVGSAAEPISFEGKAETPGYWSTIHFNSNNPLNELNYVEISDGGASSYYNYSSIWVNDNNNGSLKIYNSTVSNSYGWGLYVENGASADPVDAAGVLANNTFFDNGTGSSSSCTAPCDVIFD